MKTISFGGYTWECKESNDARVGPGPNIFSDRLVGVDEMGMHLFLEKEDGVWKCAEAILTEPLGWGTYTFTLSLLCPTTFEKHAVFGAFLYENDVQELDIEISPSMVGKGLGQFVVQPGSHTGNLSKFTLPRESVMTFHLTWHPETVHFSVETALGDLISEWNYPSTGIDSPDTARFIFNLWLYKKAAARIPQQVTITNFSFMPFTPDNA